jgi:4-hydroxybenzoate polyprenyltransferase
MTANTFQKRDSVYLKLIALLSAVRWKNVLFTAGAQYVAFLFAFNTKENIFQSLAEVKVHLIIASTAFILAGGYIINNFYDAEKDLINRPHRTRFQNLVSRGFKLNFYLLLNFIGLSIALFASWRIFLFFLAYSSLLWFYSHKLSKIVLIREFTASFLTVLAFFSLTIYFRTMSLPFFLYGMNLFFVLFAREIYKDIIWLKGDVVQGYESIVTKAGLETSKRIFQVILISSIIVDAAFLWVHTKPEFFYVLGAIAILKTLMLILIEHNIKPIHRILQLAILLFIVGIVWL